MNDVPAALGHHKHGIHLIHQLWELTMKHL